LRESGEGLSPGARAVLTTLRHELNLDAEVHGLAVDCLNVEPRLEQAIEAALGDHVETIVVETAETARKLAALVKADVRLNACIHSMRGQNVTLKDLLPGFAVAEKGGVVLIAELQGQGYVYLRP